MADWLEQYTAALNERDRREQAHKPYIDAYTKLADRISSTVQDVPDQPSTLRQEGLPPPALIVAVSKGSKGKDAEQAGAAPADALVRLRADLSTTQKARAQLQGQVTELSASLNGLRTLQESSTAQITILQKDKVLLERRVRDREDEIRGKQKLVQNAQDEAVALELQLNMSEQKAAKAERENKELVQRWMKKMGEEVERVNEESKWT